MLRQGGRQLTRLSLTPQCGVFARGYAGQAMPVEHESAGQQEVRHDHDRPFVGHC